MIYFSSKVASCRTAVEQAEAAVKAAKEALDQALADSIVQCRCCAKLHPIKSLTCRVVYSYYGYGDDPSWYYVGDRWDCPSCSRPNTADDDLNALRRFFGRVEEDRRR